MYRRKICKQGKRGLIVNLPKQWAQMMGLQAKEYLDMEPEGDRLIIRPAADKGENNEK